MTYRARVQPVPEPLTPALIPAATAALARAFRDNAGFVHTLRGLDGAAREHKLLRLMRAFATASSRYGDATVVRTAGGDVGGAALAYPPGHYPLSFAGWFTNGRGALAIGPSHTLRLARLERFMVKRHPREPHWYLFVLGVDPAAQGGGLGGALLRRLGERADAAGVASYLETDEERNVGLYRRHGYDVVDEADTPFGFHMWFMRRAPR